MTAGQLRVHQMDLLGAAVAQVVFALIILVFLARLAGRPRLEYWLGGVLFLAAVPLCYLLVQAPGLRRPALYYVQLGAMLVYLAAELVLDYVAKIEFRRVQWMTIAYVVLFFAGTGGMLGLASLAGRRWAVSSAVLFLLMAALAFVQRGKTGM